MTLLRVMIASAFLASCATTSTIRSSVQLPEGVDGYQCYRRQAFVGGFVYAEGYPDYNRGYVTLSMGWTMPSTGVGTPEIKVVWESGRPWSGSFLTVNEAVYPLPPQGTEISFRLSSGETITQILISSRDWSNWVGSNYSGYGGFVSTTDDAFMDAFTRAQWAEIDITAPDGVSVAHTRLDLSGLPGQLETMRNLGAVVEAATADYQRECSPLHFEFH